MITSEELQKGKETLQRLAVKDLEACMQSFKDFLPNNCDPYNDVLNIEGRYKEHNRKAIQQVLSTEAEELGFNQIRTDILALIAGLELEDLAPSKKKKPESFIERNRLTVMLSFGLLTLVAVLIAYWANANDAKWFKMPENKTGFLLYKIPEEMQAQEETECTVRIAFDSTTIKQGVQTEDVQMETIRTSQKMAVELIDASSEKTFEIRNILGDDEQFIEEEDYTEWRFGVTPLVAGAYDLILKVMVIEEVDGKERRKNLSFDRTIQIQTAPVDLTKVDFVNMGRVISEKVNNELEEGVVRFSKILTQEELENSATEDSDQGSKPMSGSASTPHTGAKPTEAAVIPVANEDSKASIGPPTGSSNQKEYNRNRVKTGSKPTTRVKTDSEQFVYFRYNSTKFQNHDQAMRVLSKVAKNLLQTGERITLIGYTDSSGTEAYNQSLGEKRAQKVARLLRLKGVPDDQIEFVSKGENEPVVSNATEAQRQKNRRVVLVL